LVREYIANNVFAGNSSNCGCWRRDPQKNNNSKKAYGEAAFNHVFYGYKKNAERRNLSFTLTTEEFLSFCSQPCHYCGRVKVSVASIKHAKGDRAGQLRLNGEFGYNGIDRMDNKVGYELTNCVSCCVDCNFAKTSHDYLDFLMMIKRIYENMNLEKI
jgi:5-methylcytosine-specific restriction endonuclease McrA